MCFHRVWSAIVLISAPLIAWAMFPRTWWIYACMVLGMGIALALAAATPRAWSASARRQVAIAALVLCIGGIALVGLRVGDPMAAVPFLAGIGGAITVHRRILPDRRGDHPGAGAPGTIQLRST